MIVAILLAVIYGVIIAGAQRKFVDAAKQQQLHTVAELLRGKIRERTNFALALARSLGTSSRVLELVRKGDRNQLIKELNETFAELKGNHGVSVLQFNAADMIVFLRMHNLEKFGDDPSKRSEMIVVGTRRQLPQSGVEIGVAGVQLRGLVPIGDSQGPLGTLEVGFSLQPVLQEVRDETGCDVVAGVDAEILSKGSADSAAMNDLPHLGGYRIVATTKASISTETLSPEWLAGVKEETTTYTVQNESEYGILALPLTDFGGRQIGVFSVVCDFDEYRDRYRRAVLSIWTCTAVELVILAGVVLFAFNLHDDRAEPDSTASETVSAGSSAPANDPGRH